MIDWGRNCVESYNVVTEINGQVNDVQTTGLYALRLQLKLHIKSGCVSIWRI